MKIALRHIPFTIAQREALDSLVTSYGHETIWFSNEKPALSELQNCEVLMGFFPPEMLEELPALKWVQTSFAGVDKFCGDLYANPDVILTNCSGAFGTAISEYIFTGLLMQMRRMPAYAANQRQHIWHHEGACRTISGSTITVVGMGDLGTNFARRAKAFGAHIRGVRRTRQEIPEYYDEVYTTDHLFDAISNVDAVVLCLPGTTATKGLISRECISHMSKDTILINCGRGFTVDQDALTQALAEHRISGAVLDVAQTEPMPADCPLWNMENVIITPHISGRDDDTINLNTIHAMFLRNLKHYFEGEPLENIVDRTLGY